MPLSPEMQAFIVRTIDESVRPLCDQAVILAAAGGILQANAESLLGMLSGLDESEVISTGRVDGVMPATVGDLRALAQFMPRAMEALAKDPAWPLVQKLCTRQPRVS